MAGAQKDLDYDSASNISYSCDDDEKGERSVDSYDPVAKSGQVFVFGDFSVVLDPKEQKNDNTEIAAGEVQTQYIPTSKNLEDYEEIKPKEIDASEETKKVLQVEMALTEKVYDSANNTKPRGEMNISHSCDNEEKGEPSVDAYGPAAENGQSLSVVLDPKKKDNSEIYVPVEYIELYENVEDYEKMKHQNIDASEETKELLQVKMVLTEKDHDYANNTKPRGALNIFYSCDNEDKGEPSVDGSAAESGQSSSVVLDPKEQKKNNFEIYAQVEYIEIYENVEDYERIKAKEIDASEETKELLQVEIAFTEKDHDYANNAKPRGEMNIFYFCDNEEKREPPVDSCGLAAKNGQNSTVVLDPKEQKQDNSEIYVGKVRVEFIENYETVEDHEKNKLKETDASEDIQPEDKDNPDTDDGKVKGNPAVMKKDLGCLDKIDLMKKELSKTVVKTISKSISILPKSTLNSELDLTTISQVGTGPILPTVIGSNVQPKTVTVQKSLETNPSDVKVYPKPQYNITCLIALALKNSKTGFLLVPHIYSFICEHFPYFKTAPKSWKNVVRAILSSNKYFMKVDKPELYGTERRNCYWTINPKNISKMDEELQKWSEKDPAGIKNAMVNPEILEALQKGEVKEEEEKLSDEACASAAERGEGSALDQE